MSVWGNILAAIGFAPGAQDGDNVRTGQITTERATDSETSGSFLGLSATWACVNFWAGNIAGLPVTVYRRGPGGVAVEATDHPLYSLLHDSPNYDQSAFDFWEFIVASIELQGNGYAEILRREDRKIISLTPIRPDLVRVTRRSNGDLQYSWTDSEGDHTETQERVLHIRGFGGNPLGGLSPLAVCRRTFAAASAADRAARAMFANGARPSGTLSTDKLLKAEQRSELEELLREKFVGAANSGRPMLLDNGLTWQALSLSPEDAQMLESRQFSVEDICRVFEVDPHLVGHTAGNTKLGSSIGDQTLSLLKFKMRKRLKRIEGSLEKQLLTAADRAAGVSIEFNLEGFLRADSEGRGRFYDLMKQFMTVNEVRALEGLGPVPGGDVILAQMQDIPLAAAVANTKEPAQ
ncbi:phage portal protein [Sphingomonas pituitosa]|uniref:phage portal protein n=1 Tax=Sphingomonas pituitosa TaxID=99597 RepID=UPI0008326589|nr:phage portal protein [Sphingomonas pituitosa]